MSNALTDFVSKANVPTLSDADLADAIEQGQTDNNSHGRGDGDVQFLSFSGKTGAYALGKDKVGMDPADIYIIEPMMFLAGWICWKGGKPVERIEWSFFSGKSVPEADLKDHSPYNTKAGEGWFDLLGFGCLSVDGAKTAIKFSSNAVSAKNAISDLIEEIKTRSRAGEPPLPAIQFDCEQFEAQGQKNWKPVFTVDTWMTRDQATMFFEGIFSWDDVAAGKTPTKAQLKKIAA